MTEAAARAKVKEMMRAEAKELKAKLTTFKKTAAGLEKEYAKAGARLDRTVFKKTNADRSMTEKEETEVTVWQSLGGRLRGTLAAIDSTEKALGALGDPAELERRTEAYEQQQERFDALRNRKEHDKMPTATKGKKRASLVEVSNEIAKRVVKEMNQGKGGRTIARGLNDDGIKKPGGGKWNGPELYGIYFRETGVKSVAEFRKKHPLESKSLKDREPAATTRVARTNGKAKNGNSARPTAKPDPKPSRKKAGAAAAKARSGKRSRSTRKR